MFVKVRLFARVVSENLIECLVIRMGKQESGVGDLQQQEAKRYTHIRARLLSRWPPYISSPRVSEMW